MSECSQLVVHRDGICRFYDAWTAMPARKPRRALDPIRLGAPLLPHLALLRVIGDDFRCDLVGESAADLVDFLRPGTMVSERLAKTGQIIDLPDLMRSSVRSGIPKAGYVRHVSQGGVPRHIFCTAVPLTIDGAAAADLLLGLWKLPDQNVPPSKTEIDDTSSLSVFVEKLRQTRQLGPLQAFRRFRKPGESLASH